MKKVEKFHIVADLIDFEPDDEAKRPTDKRTIALQKAARVLAKHGLFKEYSQFIETYPVVDVSSTLLDCVRSFPDKMAMKFIKYCVGYGYDLSKVGNDMVRSALIGRKGHIAKYLISTGVEPTEDFVIEATRVKPDAACIRLLEFLSKYGVSAKNLSRDKFHSLVDVLCNRGRKHIIRYFYESGCDFSDYCMKSTCRLHQLDALEDLGIDFSTEEWSEQLFDSLMITFNEGGISAWIDLEIAISMGFILEPIFPKIKNAISFSTEELDKYNVDKTSLLVPRGQKNSNDEKYLIVGYSIQENENMCIRFTVLHPDTISLFKRYGMDLDDYQLVICDDYSKELRVEDFYKFRPDERIILVSG